MTQKITVNMASESEISVQGHGVHTAYIETVRALNAHPEIELICGKFDTQVECDIVHLHTVGSKMWKKLLQKGPKKVVSAHIVPDSLVGSLVGARYWKPFALWYLRWFYNKADMLLAVSSETERDLRNMGVVAPITVLYNFIDTARYQQKTKSRTQLRQELSLPEKGRIVVGAGQVQPRKRIDLFIETAKKCPDTRFVWLGGMPFGKVAAAAAEMKRLVESAPKNVFFPGIVPLEKMVEYYQAADVFFLPSDQETFGLVVVEAAAAGLPIVLRDIPDYKDTFADNALLGATAEDFAAHIQQLSQDETAYETARQNSAKIAQRFDSKSAAGTLKEMYKTLIDEQDAH